LLVGGALSALGRQMPARAADTLEGCVAVMIFALGLRAVWRARREGANGPTRWHAHGAERHLHSASTPHVHVGRWTLAVRPLFVGLVHGLAGSGALTALVMARIPTFVGRLAYIGLFGLGSVVGMGLLTGAAGFPVARLGRSRPVSVVLLASSGALAVIVGGWWGFESVRRLAAQ
jgi:hypothetical protein